MDMHVPCRRIVDMICNITHQWYNIPVSACSASPPLCSTSTSIFPCACNKVDGKPSLCRTDYFWQQSSSAQTLNNWLNDAVMGSCIFPTYCVFWIPMHKFSSIFRHNYAFVTATVIWWRENLTCARFVDQRAPPHTTTWALRIKCKCGAQMPSSVSRWLPTGKIKISGSTVQEDGCHARKSGMVPSILQLQAVSQDWWCNSHWPVTPCVVVYGYI